MLKNLQNVVEAKCDRMKVGVAKLNETNSLVANLKQDLIKMEPILKEKGIQTSALLQDVEKQKSEASLVAIRVCKEEAEAKKQAEEMLENKPKTTRRGKRGSRKKAIKKKK